MSSGNWDQAWDEYLSTGIDPTGGELGPDFDPDTGWPLDEYQEDEPEQWQEEADAEYYEEEKPSWAVLPSYLPSRILFIDTETDGLPMEYAGNGQNYPDEAAAIHGITTERAIREGQPRKKVMRKVQDLLGRAYFIVVHNLVFDANVVAAEMSRCGIHTNILLYDAFCTMVGTTDLCKLPFPNGTTLNGQYKWPKLSELHEFLFGESFSGAHDALNDVRATARCFWELYNRKLI